MRQVGDYGDSLQNPFVPKLVLYFGNLEQRLILLGDPLDRIQLLYSI